MPDHGFRLLTDQRRYAMIDEVNFDELFGKKSETTQKAKSAPAKKQAKPSAAKPAAEKTASAKKPAKSPADKTAAPKAAAPSGASKKPEKHGALNGLLYIVFVISVSVILACLAWLAATDILALNASDITETVVLPKDKFEVKITETTDANGKTVKQKDYVADIDFVADELYDAGIIKYKWLFKIYCSLADAENTIDPGTYVLKGSYDYRALVKKMQSGSNSMVRIKITFPEGYTMNQIFKKLDEEGVCEYDELMEAAANASFNYKFLEGVEPGNANRLEGFLFPDTYEFYEGMPASSAINKLLSGFHYRLTKEMYGWQESTGLSWAQIVNIASMIEKEAANDDERARIASVIYNRLEKGWPLQIDSTTLYEYPDHVGAPTAEMLQSDSPYNTRISVGLPPTAICSPGLASIRAALRPADTNYLFYALDTETGTHRFFSSSSEFEAFIATQNYD